MIGRRQVGVKPKTIDAVLNNIYTGPSQEHLDRQVRDIGWLCGALRVAQVEIQTAVNAEGAFVALLMARLQVALDEMVEACVPFPVHDEAAA